MKQLFLCLLSLPFLLQAQDLSQLSYAELDSLARSLEKIGNFNAVIPYTQAGQAKAKAEFGVKDSVYANYVHWEGSMYLYLKQYKKAEPLIQQAIQISEQRFGKNHRDYIDYSNNLGLLYAESGSFEKASKIYEESLLLQEKLTGKQHKQYALYLDNLALLYLDMGQYDRAEPLFNETLSLYEALEGKQQKHYANVLNNLGGLYYTMGRYEQAEPVFLQALDILEKTLGKEHPEYAATLNNLAGLYKYMGKPEKSEALFLQVKSLYEKLVGKESPDYARCINNIATLYMSLKRTDEAEKLFLEATAIRAKVLGKNNPEYATTVHNLGVFYNTVKKFEQAETYLKEAISIRSTIYHYRHQSHAISWGYLAEVYRNMGRMDDYWNAMLAGIRSSSGLTMSRSITESWADSLRAVEDMTFRNIERLTASLWMHYKTLELSGENKKGEQRLLAILALDLLQRNRNSFANAKDKLRLLSGSGNWTVAALNTLDLEQDAERAFEFAEQNKAVLLMEASQGERAYQMGYLPDSLAQQEKDLLQQQEKLQAKLLERRSEAERDSLLSRLNAVNVDINAFKAEIEKAFPQYAQLKYQQSSVRVPDVQALLDEQTALVEYVVSPAATFIFYINKTTTKALRIELSADSLKQQTQHLHRALSDYTRIAEQPDSAYRAYTQAAYWFYQRLLKPVLEGNTTAKHLIIVPDGELAHLPFETFLTAPAPEQTSDYGKLDYLLRDYRISYNYAASLWKDNLQAPKRQHNGQIMGMAAHYGDDVPNERLPVYRNMRNSLVPLPLARKEVEALAALFYGYFAFDSLASERHFKAKAGEYAIIHLAMHGLLDQKSPILSSLAFSEDKDSTENNFLQAYEISQLQLNADLVVLSACETGFGKFEQGNGTASLARAFMYAGVPALLVSLWEVNDQSASDIMVEFYRQLAKGMDKAESLRQSKLAYLSKVKGISAHPAFWSPFIQMGDSRPVEGLQSKGNAWIWWAVGAAALMGMGILAMRGRRKE